MLNCSLLRGPNLAPSLMFFGNAESLPLGLHQNLLPARSFRRRGSLTPRIQGLRQALRRIPYLAPTAATATSVFAEGGNLGFGLKLRTQQLITSPYDKEIWAVALPALVAMLLEPVMNAINAGLVGHLGTQQLSAMSLGSLAVSFCTFFYTFLLFLTVPEIAAAVVKRNDDEVSCIVANSLWIAVVCGFSSAAAMFLGAEAIVGMLKPPEAAVAEFATDYIKIRSLGIPVVLLGFVATAVFRGFKDTRTPLFGALVSATISLGLNVLFLYVLRMGVVGSAVATTVAQSVSCALLLGALLGGGKVQPRHLSRPPPLTAVLPTLKLGAVLGARNMISFGMVIYASALSIRLGSTHQASFEVLRQMWLLAIQFFECLNVATQALCASYLGKEDRVSAKSLLNRLLTLGVGVGAMSGAAVWLLHVPFIAFFTRDPVVVAHVLAALPMLCLFFPIDAAAAIMDGSLLAAKQSNYMSAVQIAGSVVQYFVLAYLAAAGNINSLTVWSALKILIVCRVVGGVMRNYYSPKSGYNSAAVAAAASPMVTAEVAVSQRAAADVSPAGVGTGAATVSPPPQPAVPPGAEELWAELNAAPAAPATAAGVPPASVLQSIEDDVMVLACAACTSATDMNPDMLRLKRRQTAGFDSAAAAAAYSSISASIGNGDTGSGTLGANGSCSSEGGGGASAGGASAAGLVAAGADSPAAVPSHTSAAAG
ncbi:hypothetical protein VaNZ11_016204 [Volvox africanus]|uniref:Protein DETOXIFICATION n=1 Tax=Volvox africanus TaxID=51714 RepID=A0ABQ5SNW3_9CHLO|nr:hypothetical protein VaNZ11_016204 [Volvox africanus]